MDLFANPSMSILALPDDSKLVTLYVLSETNLASWICSLINPSRRLLSPIVKDEITVPVSNPYCLASTPIPVGSNKKCQFPIGCAFISSPSISLV